MKRVMELLRRRRVQNVLALTACAAAVLYVASSWCGGPVTPRDGGVSPGSAASSTSVEESSSFSDFFSGLFGRKSRGDNASSEDPALKNVQVEELPADDTDMHPDSAEERAAQGIIAIITEPLSAVGGKLSSFVMEGDMRVTVPTMVKDEKSFKAGKRYGAPVELTGRFVYRKDRKGNYHLHQETRSSKGDTRYDGLLYNGDLYRVGGKFHFVDAKNRLRDDVIESVISDFTRDGNEPVARRNWIHVFRDIKSVTEFDTLSDNGKLAAYSMKPGHPERQALTVQLHSLAGRVDIQQVGPVMLEGNVSGDNTYMQGYLKGSRATYRITLRIHSVGAFPTYRRPDAMLRKGNLLIRHETFGGIIATEDPPALAFADRDYIRGLAGGESPLWEGGPGGFLSAPVEAHYAVTRNCSLGCPGCYMGSVAGKDSVPDATLEGAKKIVDVLAGMGVFHAALGGGESFLIPWFTELARHARSRGVVPNVTTSGLAFTDALYNECGVFGQVNVSMDGTGGMYGHTRPGGSFEEADGALRKLGEKGIRRGINCVITRHNFPRLESIVAYARKLGLADIEFLRYKPSGRGKEHYRDMRLTPGQAVELLPTLKKLSRRYRVGIKLDCSFTPFICHHGPPKKVLEFFAIMGCDAGNWLVGVSPEGGVSPCSFVEGDELDINALPEKWGDDTTFSLYRNWDRETKTPCARCDYVSLCKGGCHAVAHHCTGSSLEPDPECPITVKGTR